MKITNFRGMRERLGGLVKNPGRHFPKAKRKWMYGGAALALFVLFLLFRGLSSDGGAAARAKSQAGRVVPVEVATADRRPMPVRIESLGNVTPIASVAVKPRLDTTITGVHFRDGAEVKKGDLLFTLDGRAIEAQIAQTEGQIARDKAQLAGAERDVNRYTDLVAKSATPVINLDNAKTQSEVFTAAIKADEGVLENLKVQLSYCTITAPIDGRISAAAFKVGNFVRQADAPAMATINQMAPVYVSFTVPQKVLPDIRQALAAETATIEAVIPGEAKHANGQVTMIENTVDPATGMVIIRATMPNEGEVLWPGTLVTTELTLRTENSIVVPSNAVQVSQTGSFVFVINDNVAKVQPVKVERTVGTFSVIGSGLNGGETVVTDGQLLLSSGTRVNPRAAKVAGS
jgi:multidrug efflux system membrane fusion protein